MITFNKPYLSGREIENIRDAHSRNQLAGDGHYTELCSEWLKKNTGCVKALLTHSCTAALEMTAILADIKSGDEVIMPSYTFVSTANAYVLRGAVPVFTDIREDTLNIDEKLIENAVTSKTRAILPVHYAGISCNMEMICKIAKKHQLMVIEDAAQGILSKYRGQALGTFGTAGALSFHETKNIISGEGGALLLNDPELVERAEIIREKGTDRSRFFRGEIDKYTWMDLGSSYLPGELIAAFLYAQMLECIEITNKRREIWHQYHDAFEDLEASGRICRPVVPEDCEHNAHLYYLLLKDEKDRSFFIKNMKKQGIACVFHYVPLHSSPAGRKYGRTNGRLAVTDSVAGRLVRLPLWIGMRKNHEISQVIDAARQILSGN